MKTKLFIAALSIVVLTAFKFIADNSAAKVEQMQGLYIFMYSKPIQEYKYLGSVKKGMTWSGSAESLINGTLKKIKKEYPDATGVIFTDIDMNKADAIQFKE